MYAASSSLPIVVGLGIAIHLYVAKKGPTVAPVGPLGLLELGGQQVFLPR